MQEHISRKKAHAITNKIRLRHRARHVKTCGLKVSDHQIPPRCGSRKKRANTRKAPAPHLRRLLPRRAPVLPTSPRLHSIHWQHSSSTGSISSVSQLFALSHHLQPPGRTRRQPCQRVISFMSHLSGRKATQPSAAAALRSCWHA